MWTKKEKLIILGILLIISLPAQSEYDYLLRQPKSLRDLARQHFTESRSFRYQNLETYMDYLKKWNPQISSQHYSEIPIGTQVYLDIPYSPYAPNLEYAKKLRLGKNSQEKNYFSMDLGLGMFQRTLIQKNLDTPLTLEAIQRSPVSIDSSLIFKPSMKNYEFELNWKVSHLMASTSNTETKFPSTQEYSLTPSLSYRLSEKYKINVKMGGRYQRFVTFNLPQIAQGRNIQMINYDIAYLNAGLNWSFDLFGYYNKLGVSFSRAAYATNDTESSAEDFSSNIIYIENNIEIERLIYGLFYEIESSSIEGLESTLTRVGANIRFYLF